ncbi:MAG: acylphosphatase [Ignisphaera sp.]|uniref:Acylphosphatase-like domain-containing protein n=1 Tax=Ignisphaera aggregans TaxID=334771 RepID=A0A7C4D3U3_9CREN
MMCLKIYIKGVVKGVGYLAYIYIQAERLSIKGYARYFSDDIVEVVAIGSEDTVSRFVDRLRFHDTMAIVNNIEINKCSDIALTNVESFEIYFS